MATLKYYDTGTSTWKYLTTGSKGDQGDPATNLVTSVAGRQGVVTLTKTDVALSNVDNTTDASKPISTATQTALDTKVDKVSGKGLSTEDYSTAEKTKLSGIATGATLNSSDATLLARANHTGTQTASTISDFSTAADARIAAEASTGTGSNVRAASPALTGTPTAPTATQGDNSTKISTTAYVDTAVAAVEGSDVDSFNGRTGTVVPASGDYTATQTTNTPAGNIAATDVQSAINELDTEKAPVAGTPTLPTFAFASGTYLTPCQGAAIGALASASLRVFPFFVPQTLTIARIGAEITTIGDAGSKVRLGVYADNGAGVPGSLLLDAGQINGDSATVQEITLGSSLVLTRGWYWTGGASQSVTVTAPTARTVNTVGGPVGQGGGFLFTLGTSLPAAGAAPAGYSHTGVTGALPSTFTNAGMVGIVPRVFFKLA